MISYKCGNFCLVKNSSECKARLGQINTARGFIDTPVFMPVGTYGTIKGIPCCLLRDAKVQIMLANSYHLYLRPGADYIKKSGGIQQFNSWHKPMLTDSGGFQIFSLQNFTKVYDDGVEFKSPINGEKHFFYPEKSIRIQKDIGADIIMCLDECTTYPVDYNIAKNSVDLSIKWAKRCHHEFYTYSSMTDNTQILFGIIQGSIYNDLRIQSTYEMLDINFDGYAIGGLSVGEPKHYMYSVLQSVLPILPTNKARYLMGVGSPEDLWKCVELGVDMFDCVIPTRNGRNGQVLTSIGKFNIKNSKFKNDYNSLDPNCTCLTCNEYSRAYLNYLIKSHDILYMSLLSLHNIHFMMNLMHTIREALKLDIFIQEKEKFLKQYNVGE
ncbi:MAG: tRNA guanosine(34) transglycosylase Tgt [Endomicrobium sp.]|jgi:queuine tRNA-ribosyltransferase|nr:tRNA guanosine(34) transglycosylase Tgt [Endomicrobium sp.]